jgi:hypothetical protein
MLGVLVAALLLGSTKNKNTRPLCSDVGFAGVAVDAIDTVDTIDIVGAISAIDAISAVDAVDTMDAVGTVDAVGPVGPVDTVDVILMVNMLVHTFNNDMRIGAAISKATRISTSQDLSGDGLSSPVN